MADARPRDPDSYLTSRPYAWLVFALTFLLMVFDFVDRQIIVSMFPHLKAEWHLSDAQLGVLVSVVSVTVALGTFPLAFLVDRWSRVKSIALMAIVWSLATLACGLSRNFGQLLIARSVIGLGEAGYGPAGGALLSTIFPARLRGTIMGAFLAAASLGAVLGVMLGGLIAARWGWQAGFGVVGVPGLVLGLVFLALRDYDNVALTGPAASSSGSRAVAVVKELFRPRSGVAAYIGGALQLLVVAAVYVWLPSHLNRAYGMPASTAGVWAGAVVLLGSVGTIVWGFVADRASRTRPRRKLLVPAACVVITFVLLLVAFAFLAPGRSQFVLIGMASFLMTAAVGPVTAVAIDVVHPGLRATAASLAALIQNLFGLAAGPFIAGVLSDIYGLQPALSLMSVFGLLSALVFVIAASRYEADLAGAASIPISVEKSTPSVA